MGLHISKSETLSETEPEMLFQCETSYVARVVDTCKKQRKNQYGFCEAKSCLKTIGVEKIAASLSSMPYHTYMSTINPKKSVDILEL